MISWKDWTGDMCVWWNVICFDNKQSLKWCYKLNVPLHVGVLSDHTPSFVQVAVSDPSMV
jgi:predicted RNA-binding protein with PUA domain